MSRSLIPDPFALWREAINRLEAGANELANRKIANSQELAKTLNQFAAASLGAQHLFEKTLAGVFARLDIPSRTEVAALGEALQRIEDKLDQLLPASARVSIVPRPPRTRRPPPDVPPAAVPAKKASARPAARRARKEAGR